MFNPGGRRRTNEDGELGFICLAFCFRELCDESVDVGLEFRDCVSREIGEIVDYIEVNRDDSSILTEVSSASHLLHPRTKQM